MIQSPLLSEEAPVSHTAPSAIAPTTFSTRFAATITILHVAIVRVRMFLVLFAVLLFVGFWPVLRNYADRVFHVSRPSEPTISPDTDYWCPMCPGVVSDWPGKCPVCNMSLVRRKKGEATPLPDGVLARMQFSPYRIQLAGVKTAIVEYRPLRREVVLVGLVQRSPTGTTAEVAAEAFASDLPFLNVGQAIEASSEGLPGHVPFRGKIVRIESSAASDRVTQVRLVIDDPEHDLRLGALVSARAEASLARASWWRRSLVEECRNRAAVEALVQSLAPQASLSLRLRSALATAVQQAVLSEGVGLAVPVSAIIDHGSRKVAFVESEPGMFDAVEVTVGPRCGDFYPVLRGLQLGQHIVAAGAFLLDAEMSLSHDLSAAWFGAARSSDPLARPPTSSPTNSPTTSPSNSLSEADRLLAAKQKVCPVRGELLDSMGGPVRVDVAGKTVFVCCKGCTGPLLKDPAKYLEKLKP